MVLLWKDIKRYSIPWIYGLTYYDGNYIKIMTCKQNKLFLLSVSVTRTYTETEKIRKKCLKDKLDII